MPPTPSKIQEACFVVCLWVTSPKRALTMFNTGTVVGVNANVFGAGFQSKHIPSFSWGGAAEGVTEYRIEKALQVAYETVSRRNFPFGEVEKDILRNIFEQTRPRS